MVKYLILLFSFTFSTVTDIDGNVYETIQIGEQLWMAENLKVTQYNNGDPITHVTNNGDWGSYDEGQYGIYDNDPSYAETYGNLYNWAVVDDSRGVCPEGWHVPSDDEWKELEMAVGMSQAEADDTGHRGTNEASKLAGNAVLWNEGDLKDNARFGVSGFNALPSGYHVTSNNVAGYYGIGSLAYFWSSSDFIYYDPYSGNDIIVVWTRSLSNDNASVFRFYDVRQHGFSLRCVSDAEMLGDLNGDGIINVLDVVTIVNIILNGGDYNPLADLNLDSTVDILDIVQLVNIILN